MSSPTSQLEPPSADVWSVRKVVQLGVDGMLRIPDFQRPFRWGAKDVRDLFDSVLNGYPIGSVALGAWDAPAETVSFGPLAIDVPARPDALFVLDGQQRLTSLVAVLAGYDAVVRSPFELYVDLDDGAVKTPDHRRRIPPTWLPLRLILDTPALLRFLRNAEDAGVSEELSTRATTVVGRIADFRVPVSIVQHGDEQAMRAVFLRLNTAGKHLTGGELLGSRRGAESGGLRDLALEITSLGFGRFSDDDALRYVLALRGGDPYRTNWQAEFVDGTDPASAYRETLATLRRVIGFLRDDAAIPHRLVLPYSAVLPVLVRFFALHPQPADYTRLLLRRWVWRSVASWAGNRDPKPVRIAVRDLDDEGRRSDEGDQVLWLLDQLGEGGQLGLDLNVLRMNVAATRTNIALLGTLVPRDLVSGEEVDLAGYLDRTDPPGAVLASFAPDGAGTDAPDGDAPVTAAFAWRLLQPVGDADSELSRDDALITALMAAADDVLASHGFDDDAIRALRDGELLRAGAARERALATRLLDAWEQLAEPDAVDRPALESLTVDD